MEQATPSPFPLPDDFQLIVEELEKCKEALRAALGVKNRKANFPLLEFNRQETLERIDNESRERAARRKSYGIKNPCPSLGRD